MAERARRTGASNPRAYVDGNTVRKMQAAPQYAPQPRRRPEQPQKTREELRRTKSMRIAARRNQQRALEMNRGYVAFLTAATAVCLAVCLLFVHVQADNTARLKTITSLENQITELRADNLAAEKRLETTMNLEEVKAAASAMGFAYPKADQIVYYTVEDSDYMNQYEAIPSN